MLGFLGTVIGMVQAFMNISQAGGTVDMSILASGMYVAMITTVGGLIVGIPAYFGYNYLVARDRKTGFPDGSQHDRLHGYSESAGGTIFPHGHALKKKEESHFVDGIPCRCGGRRGRVSGGMPASECPSE